MMATEQHQPQQIGIDLDDVDMMATAPQVPDPDRLTHRQAAFIESLRDEADLPDHLRDRLDAALPTMTRVTASETIDWLKSCVTKRNLWRAQQRRAQQQDQPLHVNDRTGLSSVTDLQRKSAYSADRIKVTMGYYRHAEQIYKVIPSRVNPGRLYAKRLLDGTGTEGVKPEWVAARGMVYRLRASERMDADAISAFGRVTGFCLICGRLLTNPDSIEAGIGPVCATRI